MDTASLEVLTRLEQEMAESGRTAEQTALREARQELTRRGGEFITTGQAAERLGISIPTVKNWLQRGTLFGYQIGTRWYISLESVDHIVRLRRILKEMDEEGNPTDEEIQEMYRRRREEREARQRAAG